MNEFELEIKLEQCKSMDERAQVMREYYNCSDDHKKVSTAIYAMLPTALVPLDDNEIPEPIKLNYQVYDDIACAECKRQADINRYPGIDWRKP